jgi:hypothetical protein
MHAVCTTPTGSVRAEQAWSAGVQASPKALVYKRHLGLRQDQHSPSLTHRDDRKGRALHGAMLVNSGRTRPAAAAHCMRRSIVLWLMRCAHHQSARIRCAWRHQRLAAAPRDTRPLQLIERSAYSCLASQRPGIYLRPSALTSARARAPLARQRCTKSARCATRIAACPGTPAAVRPGPSRQRRCRALPRLRARGSDALMGGPLRRARGVRRAARSAAAAAAALRVRQVAQP